MCQLLAMNCTQPTSIRFSFAGFRARGGRTDEHKDGWGIAFSRPSGFEIYRDELPAAESHLAEHIGSSETKANTIIAHIRKATMGAVRLSNCHPFERKLWGKSWLFCHNGDLKNYAPALTGSYVPEGDTDSEQAFCALLQSLQQQFPEGEPPLAQLFDWLHHASGQIAEQGTFNIMLSNGDWLFTYCSTHLAYVERQYPFARIELIDTATWVDLAAHNSREDRMVVIATTPLTRNEPWQTYQPGQARLFKNGQLAHEKNRS